MAVSTPFFLVKSDNGLRAFCSLRRGGRKSVPFRSCTYQDTLLLCQDEQSVFTMTQAFEGQQHENNTREI